MSKQKQIHEMVIATAYLHAINYTLYGEDVTEKWLTATQNASALEKAYKKVIMMPCKDRQKVRIRNDD